MHVILSHGVQSTDLKACRQLASDITARGAKLHELLGREVELRVRDCTTIMSLAVWHKDNLPDQNILFPVFVCLSPGRICASRPYLRQWTLRSWREEYTAVSPRLKYAPHSPSLSQCLHPFSPPPLLPSSLPIQSEIQRVQQMLGNLGGDEASLEVKIEKKRQDLERNQKRLRSLANVR